MKIRKAYQGTVPENKILDTYSTSQTDTYSCNYVNKANDYSTTETVIGKWIDDKPIYRKVITGSSLTLGSNQWVTITLSVPNNSYIINVFIINNGNGQVMPLCAYVDNGHLSIMNIRTATVNYGSGYTLIAEYTKSTD